MTKVLLINIFINLIFSASITPKQIDTIFNICSTNNYSQDDLQKILSKYNVKSITNLSQEEANIIIATLDPNNISNNISKNSKSDNSNSYINKIIEKKKHTYSNIKPRKSRYSYSIGMSENLGGYGGLTFKINLNDYIYLTGGSSLIIGGGGLGIRYSLNKDRISPFISSALFQTYTIPLMCENCDGFIYNNFITIAIGLDILTIQTQNKSYHIQLGILSYIYSKSINRKKSAHEKPTPLPFINIKFSI